MKTKRKPQKLLSLLLCCVMLVGMMPMAAGTVFATNPAIGNVLIDGGKCFYAGKEYYKNGDESYNFTGSESDYNAHYDPDTGILTLKDYTGGGIAIGGAIQADITIELIGTNTVTGSIENDLNGGGDITITGSGSLTVDKTGSDNFGVCGIAAGYSGTSTNGNITIADNANVTINTTNNNNGAGKAYGIYAKQSITISDNAFVDITCSTPSSTSSSGTCYGMFVPSATSGGKVTINTGGTIKIDVKNTGSSPTSYGISAPNYDLTKVDNMIVEWKGTSGRAFSGTGPTFDPNQYAVNVDTTNCYASYRYGTPYTVTVANSYLTGPGVKYQNGQNKYYFLEGDEITLTAPDRQVSSTDTTNIPFVNWVSDDVTITSSESQTGATFTMPSKNVKVTAKYNPFETGGEPKFTYGGYYSSSSRYYGDVSITLVSSEIQGQIKLYPANDLEHPNNYANFMSSDKTYTATIYSNTCSAGEYVVAVTYNGTTYYSEPFTVNYSDTPAANITLDKSGTVDFGSKEAGYTSAPEAQTVTITNNGTAATGDLTVALSGTNESDFTVSPTSISSIATGGTETFTVQPNTGLATGTYEATVKVSGAGVTEQSFNVKFVVTAAPIAITETLVPVSDLTGKTYNESAQEPTFEGSLIRNTDYEVSYAIKSGSTGSVSSDGKPVGAGTYVVTVTGKGSYNSSFTKDFKIDKATPEYTAPTAKTGLVYTGSSISLINAGTVAKGGEMQYKLGSDTYSTTIPAATNAGNYTVYYKITENDNYNAVAETQVGTSEINIALANQPAPTGLGVQAPTTADGKGKITGTSTEMEYATNTSASSWTSCTGTNTEVTPGTYYVRYNADANHNASPASAALTVPNYTAETYEINITDGTASPNGNQHAGTTITITANTPASGMIFDKWIVESGAITLTDENSASTTFIMPASAVSIKATYKGATLTGTVTITGTEKFGETLTASVSGSNNTGTLTYKWYRGSDATSIGTDASYTITADDIGKTLTCKVTSSVQTGMIENNTATIEKADGPAAPTGLNGVACTTSANNDGKITGVDNTMEYSTTADFASKTTCTGTEITGLTNGTYYIRIAETATHKAGAYTEVTVAAYTAPPAPPSGGGLIPAVQEPDITIIGSGKATLSTDGSTADIAADEGYELVSITVNGKEIANTDKLTGLKTGDKVVITFQKKSEEPTVDTKTIVEKVGKMKLTARSSKTTKKNIKITVNTDKETSNLIKEIKDLGYTVKYKYYRSTKKASKYTAKVEKDADINSYINTSGKKSTKYYYKVRVMVYDADGNLVAKSDLKQCKYASRTWSK